MTTTPDQDGRAPIAPGIPYATDDGARMRGTAIHGGYFDVPLITHVKGDKASGEGGELWQGGCIQGYALPEDFDFVLSLYPWEKYILGPTTRRVEVKMYDDLNQGFEQVEELAMLVIDELCLGAKVLVHCQAGLNRSGLLAARVLTLNGMDPPEAIDLLRVTRGTDQVLCNIAFEEYIRNTGVGPLPRAGA